MKKVIHYVLILDRSGSMQDIKPIVIKSFNEQVDMIHNLQERLTEAKIKVTLCSFNDAIKIHYLGKKAEELDKLTAEAYQPDSMTALYDAIGYTFHRGIEGIKSHHTVFFTDGR